MKINVGYSLIEVVVSLAIFSVGITGVIKLLTVELWHAQQIIMNYQTLAQIRQSSEEKQLKACCRHYVN